MPGVCLLLLALCACAPTVRVQTDHRSDWDFAAIETVALMPWDPDPELLLRMDPLVLQRQRAAAISALRAQGYAEAPAAEADVLVSVLLREDQRLALVPERRHPGHHHHWYLDPFDEHRYLRPVPVQRRILLIDLIDRRSRAVIWRGSAVSVPLDAPPPLAARMLAVFPPVP